MSRLTKEDADVLNKFVEDRFNQYYDFIKTVISSAITLFALVVGLYPINKESEHHSILLSWVFAGSITSLLLGVFCLAFGLFGFVKAREAMSHDYLNVILTKLRGLNDDRDVTTIYPKLKKRYTYALWIGFFSLCLCITGFTIYLVKLSIK